MISHKWLAMLLFMIGAVAIGCGGDGDSPPSGTGTLTDPKSVPTAAVPQQLPEIILLEAGSTAPLPGQSGQSPTARAGAGSCSNPYTVESGDNPSAIAEKCDVGLQALLAANPGLNSANLLVGQQLNLPR